jgi:hypothetical protein
MARSIERLTIRDLNAEIRRRERSLRTIRRRRSALAGRLARLDAQIASLGGSVNGRASGGRRPRNEMTLVDSLAKALKGKTMSVTDAAEAVQKAGYRTGSSNFHTQVNIALIKSGKFKRVDRGQYTAK